jgi:hypothetical protein
MPEHQANTKFSLNKENHMKKILTFGVIFSFAAAAAFAEDKKDEPKITFNASLSSFAHAVSYKSVTKDDNGSFSELRFQPTFTVSNGSIDGILQLRYDTQFGAKEGNDNLDNKNFNTGLEGKHSNLLVRQAYLSSKVDDVAGLKLSGGISPYDFPLVFGDVAPMFGATYEKGPATVSLYYAKTYEGAQNKSNDDAQFAIADLTLKFGDQTIRPAIFYTKAKKNAYYYTTDSDNDKINDSDAATAYGTNFTDGSSFIPALTMNLVYGSFGLDATGAYVKGKGKYTGTETTVKFNSYAVDFAPYYKLNDNLKFTVFGTLISGDNDTTDGKDTSFIDGTIDGLSSGINIWRMYILEDGGTFAKFSDVAGAKKYSNTNGYLAGGLVIDASAGKFTFRALGAYAQVAKAASGQKKGMGIETDLNIGYAVTKGATLFVEGAFLKTGKAYGDSKQNAQYISAGLSASL